MVIFLCVSMHRLSQEAGFWSQHITSGERSGERLVVGAAGCSVVCAVVWPPASGLTGSMDGACMQGGVRPKADIKFVALH